MIGGGRKTSGNYTNRYDLALSSVEAEGYVNDFCVWCGKAATDKHHVVYRSHGGIDDVTVTLCPYCHGMAHSHLLHFMEGDILAQSQRGMFRPGVIYALKTAVSTKVDKAVGMRGWIDLTSRIAEFRCGWDS